MGLLDFLNTDEGRLGLGLLAASGPRSDGMGAGGRIQEAFSGQEARKDAAMKRQFQQSQMENYASEIEARKLAGIKDQRQQAMIGSLMGGSQGGASDQGGPSSQGAPGIMELARQYGIPEKAIQADMVFNGGKKISELLAKHGGRDMQVSNGYAYDKNRTGAGFMPSLNTSANGQTSMTRIGPDGLPVVGSPQGALETYGAYKGMDAGLGAAAKVNLRKNADGTESPVSELTENPTLQGLLGGRMGAPAGYASEPQMKTTVQSMAADQAGNPAAIQREIKATQNDLMKPLDAASRAQLQAHLTDLRAQSADPRNAARPGAPAGAPSYGMTNEQVIANKAKEESALGAVKDTAETRKTIMTAGFAAPSAIAKYRQLGKLLEGVDGGSLTAAGTNIASTMNSLGFKVDKNLPNKQAAAALGNEMALELRSPASGAGMPGAMSDKDREFLVGMIPNASQSAQGRKQLLEARIAIEERKIQTATFARNYEKKYGRMDNGFFEQLSAWSSQNPLFKGK